MSGFDMDAFMSGGIQGDKKDEQKTQETNFDMDAFMGESSTPEEPVKEEPVKGATDVDSFMAMHEKKDAPAEIKETTEPKKDTKTTESFAFDYNGKKANVGDFVAVEDEDGNTSLKKVNDPSDGRAVLEDVGDKPIQGKIYPTLSASEWSEGLKSGKIRRNVSPAYYRRLQQIAETGSELYENDKTGNAASVISDVLPFGGRHMIDKERGKIARMEKYVKGEPELSAYSKVDQERALPAQIMLGAAGGNQQIRSMTEDEQWAEEARLLGVDASAAKRGKDEDSEAYKKRLRGLVFDEMKKTVSRQDKAKRELEYIEKDWKDMVFGSGRQSVGYSLEFATSAPMGGLVGGAAKGASLAARIGRTAAKVAVEAQPVAIVGALSDYEKFRENGYTMKDGALTIKSVGDDPETALFKAIAKNESEAITEIGLGYVTAPLLRGIGKVIGKNTVGKAIVDVAKGYSKIRQATKFGDILFEELPEENVQYFFSDILGWGKKDSEYKGFMEEWNAAWSDGGQYTPKEQWNTALGMLLQMGGQAAIAGGAKAVEVSANSRELANILEGAGLSKEQVSKLSYGKRMALARFHNTFANDPKKLQEALERFGGYLGKNADEFVGQMTIKTENDIASYGETPHKFEIQTEADANGNQVPKFKQQLHIDGITGRQAVRKEMFDPKAGVTIVDNGTDENGKPSYEVYDEIHPERSFATDNFGEAQRCADLYALTNQKSFLDNRRKEAYALNLLNTKYKNSVLEGYDTVGNLYAAFVKGLEEEGHFHGYTDLRQMFKQDGKGGIAYPPQTIEDGAQGAKGKDGAIILILDNIKSAKKMNEVFSHESKHIQATEDMLMRISPDSECGKEIERVRELYKAKGIEVSELKIREEGFAYWAMRRGHNPSLLQRASHALTGGKGKLNDADLEVIVSRMEKEGENGSGGTAEFILATDTISDSMEIPSEEKEETNETRTDEEQPEPEQAAQPVEGEGEAARPVEEGEAPAEVGGAVETATEAATSAPTETKANTPSASAEGAEGGSRAANAAKKPVEARSVIEKMTEQAPVEELPVAEVFNDDTRIPNFKEGANPETGEVEPLTGEPYDLVSNPIVVMEFKDGKKVVVTGRHRLALYKRAGREKIAARVIREADGWTVNDARMIDSIGNIIDEKGSVKDYVKYFEDAKPSREAAEAGGFLSRQKGRLAFSIYEGASADTRAAIDFEGGGADGKISVEQAGIISEAAPVNAHPRNKALQRILVGKALAGVRGKKLGILARSLAEEVKNEKSPSNVGGEIQLDLFTSVEDQALLAMEDKRADYRTRKGLEYTRIAEVLRTAISKGGKLDLNEEYARELGITDPKDKKQLAAARDKAVERANYWETAVRLDDADKAAMDAEINAKADAAAKKQAEIKAKVETSLKKVKAAREGKPVETPKVEKPVETAKEGEVKAPEVKTEEPPKKSERDIAYEEWLNKFKLKDTPKHRAEWERKNPVKAEKPVEKSETPKAETAEKKVETPKEAPKSAESSKEAPSKKKTIKFKDAKDAEEARKALATIDFMSEEFDTPDFSQYRRFDVVVNGKLIPNAFSGYTRKQANGYARIKYGKNAEAYELGAWKKHIESGIISRREEQIRAIDRQYALGLRKAGVLVPAAIKAGLFDYISASQISQHDGGIGSRIVEVSRSIASLRGAGLFGVRGVDINGWTNYSNGSVVIPIKGQTKATIKNIIALNQVFPNTWRFDGFGKYNGKLFALVKTDKVGEPIEVGISDKHKFLEENGFTKSAVYEQMLSRGVDPWTKDGIFVDAKQLVLGKTEKGETFAYNIPCSIRAYQIESGNAGIDFMSEEFDPEKFGKLVTGVGKVVDVLVRNNYKDFKSLATYIYQEDENKYDRAKPVLQDIWNAVARSRGLKRISDDEAEQIFANIESSDTEEDVEPKTPPANKLNSTRISDAADEIVALIEKGTKFSRKDITDIVERQLGGKVSNGDFDAKQVTDILELAVNRYMQSKGSIFSPAANAGSDNAVAVVNRIRNLLGIIPTHTTRSVEQDALQQFSTPPHEAFVAAWTANIKKDDVMLEPSAGIGGLAVFADIAGAKVVLNEYSPRRAEILEQLGLGKPYDHDAQYLYALLEPEVKSGKIKRPTVVVMNPPFSNSVSSGRKNTHIGAEHVEQALKLLAPGGRLVAIVGNGMAHNKPAFKNWWDRIGKEYTVRANIGISGQEYAKYGTTFDNNIIVIDKVTPNGSITPIYGKISSLDELPAMLEGVRNDRPEIRDTRDEQVSAEQSGGESAFSVDGGTSVEGGVASPIATGSKTVNGRTGTARPSSDGRKSVQGGTNSGVGTQVDRTHNGRGDGFGVADGSGRGNTNGSDDRRNSAGAVQPDAVSVDEGLIVENVDRAREVGDGTFSEYKPSKVNIPGMKPHPTALVESSAMASVQPPNPTYSPKIPKKIIEDGVLSEAQIEQVVYAGQSHEQKLGNGERKGYFIGDGTGVGKGREIAGVIFDNFNNGRRKAVWVSKTSGLANDAKRDLTPFGLGEEIFTLETKNMKGLGGRSHGVAFTTYASLAKDHSRVDERGNVISAKQGKKSRMQALVEWLGRDFDGVIVFDESHLAGNAVPVKGKRGFTKPSQQALAVVDIQKALPNARILYVSATGATEVNNLAYATRLGLWGKGTAFKDRDAFITQVSNGGISVMEVVARDMKAMGVYMARTLSYEGIENERVTHELSPDQVKQYNLLAETWQMVMSEMESALVSANGIHGKANGASKSAFWGAHQRFFNQTLTAMQMPSVLAKARELWENGYSPVFQIVTTNEAAQNRAIQSSKDAGGEIDVENLDLSPRDILIGFVEHSFPTVQYIEIDTGEGTKWVPMVDLNGNPIQDPSAVERKERLLGRLRRMKMGEAPLDMILNEFGHENVAEVTGRSARREMVRNADGEMEMKIVRRTKNNAKQEADEFNDGERTVLVFSGAGNTGFSFHADRKFKNQRRRVQFMIEAGYNAAAAIQGLGRTHRANESSHPLYELCSTNLPGHKRFMSTIARRLAQLGSLTSGDRSSSGSGVFSEADNLENQYAKNAVLDIFETMFHDEPDRFNHICEQMGFMKTTVNPRTGEREFVNTLIDNEGNFDAADKLDIPHFLNRILAMNIDAQNELFDMFTTRMAEKIERAKEAGTFDPGMEKLKGETIEIKNRTRLWQDNDGIGNTDIVEVGVTRKSKKIDYNSAIKKLSVSMADGAVPHAYIHDASGALVMMVETKAQKTQSDGTIVNVYRQLKPNGDMGYTTSTAVDKNYTPLGIDAEARWNEAYDNVPELIESPRYFAHGTLLPVWDKFGSNSITRFFKVVPTVGTEMRPFLGMEIQPENVDNVLMRFGKAVGAVKVTPEAHLNRIMKDGKKIDLQNGWTLKRVKVLGDNRIEIDGVDEDEEILRIVQEPYAYAEKIGGYLRVFVKPDADNMAAFLEDYPAVPDRGGLNTVSGNTEDMSGDKYKDTLHTIWKLMNSVGSAEAETYEAAAKSLIMTLSSEQLEEVFHDYEEYDTGYTTSGRKIRRLAANELRSRGHLPWKIEDEMEANTSSGDSADFMSDEFNPEVAPATPENDKQLYGFTNEEVALALKAADMEPPKHKVKSDEVLMRQAESLLSNREYMRKLAKAVYMKARPTKDYENLALGMYAEIAKGVLNETKAAYDELLAEYNELPTESDSDKEAKKEVQKILRELKLEMDKAKQEFRTVSIAKIQGASEQGRALRSNRILIDLFDNSYAGLRGQVEEALGNVPMSEKMDAEIGNLAKNFKDLDAESYRLAVERLKAFSQKIVTDFKKNGERLARLNGRAAGNELKRVTKNYNNALIQIEVHANEAGGTLIGLADQVQPMWGKWLKALGEYHCYMNPDITEQGVIDAIRDDLSKYLDDGLGEDDIRDILTGYGHNYRQSRYDSQRKMNDLRAQSLLIRQRNDMLETGKLPQITGMVRDEPSADTRALRKEVQQLKKEIDQQEGGANALKGALASAKTRIRNQIEDLERALLNGEKIERSKRTLVEDVELKQLRAERDELRKTYDEVFGKNELTEEQRISRAEKVLEKALERALERLGRAKANDFHLHPSEKVSSDTIDDLRAKIKEVNETIRELKKAKFPDGTPEEQAKRNAVRMKNRQRALERLAERIMNGDIRSQVKKAPPMPPEMQKRYDEMGEQMKRARERLAELRLEAENATEPTFKRKGREYFRFITTVQRGLRATADMSAILRQVARITLGNPSIAKQSFGKAWEAAKSEVNLLTVNDEIMSDPLVQEAVNKFGLHLREIDSTKDRDIEEFHGIERNYLNFFGKRLKITDIPFFGEVILKSERHYLTYLNAASAELYTSIINDKSRFPNGATPWQKKIVADMINMWNGSAALSKERRNALKKAWVNDIFWAPQLAISRIQSAVMYDIINPIIAKGIKNEQGEFEMVSRKERKTVAKIIFVQRLKSTVGMLALGALIFWMDADEDDWYNFNQSNWFKKLLMIVSPKVGNTSLDFTGGEAGVYRVLNKIYDLAVHKETKTLTGRTIKAGSFGGADVSGTISRYFQGKLAPWISTAYAISEGKNFVGEEYTLKRALTDAFVPLTFEDIAEQIEQNGIGRSLVTIPFSLLGAGGGTYDRKVYENAINAYKEARKEMEAIRNDATLDYAERRQQIEAIQNSNRLMDPKVSGKIDFYLKAIRSDEKIITTLEKDMQLRSARGSSSEVLKGLAERIQKANERISSIKEKIMELIRANR